MAGASIHALRLTRCVPRCIWRRHAICRQHLRCVRCGVGLFDTHTHTGADEEINLDQLKVLKRIFDVRVAL